MEEKNSSVWLHCPKCGSKTRDKILPKTIMINYPLYCPKCKRELLVSVKNLSITIIKECNQKSITYESPVQRIERGAGLFSFLEILSAVFDVAYTGHTFALHVHDDYSILSMVEQGLGISILTELVLHKTSYDVVG